MNEEQMIQAMLADAKQVNKRYREKWGGKPDSKFIERKPKATAAPTQGEGWRNSSLSKEEIEDIKYFQSKGWCVTSTAIFLGLSDSTVRKYREDASRDRHPQES
jgi:hypothetical protein